MTEIPFQNQGACEDRGVEVLQRRLYSLYTAKDVGNMTTLEKPNP